MSFQLLEQIVSYKVSDDKFYEGIGIAECTISNTVTTY